MKKSAVIIALVVSVVLSSCGVMKKDKTNQDSTKLSGEWVLTYITGPRITFDGLFPEAKPTIVFDLEKAKVSGNNSCNSYGGDLVLKGNTIKIEKPFSTMMACQGSGEGTYMEILKEIETYKIDETVLSFYKGDIEVMRFSRK